MPTGRKANWPQQYILLVSGKILVLVLLFFTTGISEQFQHTRQLGTATGDTDSYFLPIDHWRAGGPYAADPYRLESYAGRMPGYGAVYAAARLACAPPSARNVVVIVQVLLDVLTSLLLLRMVRALFTGQLLRWLAAALLGFSAYAAVYDYRLVTESISLSAVIICLYGYYRAWAAPRSAGWLLLSGIAVAWAVFLKSYLGLLLVGLPLLAIGIGGRAAWRTRQYWVTFIGRHLVWVLPFVVADSLWLARNYALYHGRFVPLQIGLLAGYDVPESDLYLRQYVVSWGGNPTYWEPEAHIRWFVDSTRTPPPFPAVAFTRAYPPDSIVALKAAFQRAGDHQLPPAHRRAIDQNLAVRLQAATAAQRREHPGQYYVRTTTGLLRTFLFHNGSYNLSRIPFAQASLPLKLLRLFYTLLFALVVVAGIVGAMFIGRRRAWASLFVVPIVLCIGLFPVVFRTPEIRYLALAYPFLSICAAFMLATIAGKWPRRQPDTAPAKHFAAGWPQANRR